MKKINLIIMMLGIISFMSCKKFLDEPSRVEQDIKTADQLEALINNARAYVYDSDNPTPAYATDDTEISAELYKSYPYLFAKEDLYQYVFDVDHVIGGATDLLWTGEYRKIFTANVVLNTVDEVSGPQEQKNQIKADAFFMRAYSYWNLVNYYCLPYAPENSQSKGLPLKKTTDYSESLKRSTLQETYDFIMSDLQQAKNLTTNAEVQPPLRWRISRPGIDAFLSRVYLFLGDYDKCLQYANLALTSQNTKLVDFKNIGPNVTNNYTNPTATLTYSALNNWTASRHLFWEEFYYVRFTYSSSQWFLPSQGLLSLYDRSNDMRYQLFMIPNGGRRFGVVSPSQFRYAYFNDGRYLTTGPNIAEVLLNKAEALVRKGDLSGALASVNQLREKRLRNYVALTAVNQADGLIKVLQERRREVPFSFRWWDIRRFSVNETLSDDVVVTRSFLKLTADGVDENTPQNYVLPVKSARYAIPINAVEINASQGQIEQNNY